VLSESDRVIIAGAGIGGLAAASAVREAGAGVTVLEQADSMAKIQVGIGMVLWPNGMRALQRLGVADVVEASANPLSALEFYSASGERLMRYPVAGLSKGVGAPSVAFVRRRLHEELTSTFGDDAITLGARVESFVEEGDGVTVQLADGGEVRGDVLIAADGVHSGLRQRVLGLPGLPEFPPYRYTVWHSIIPFPDRELIKPGVFYLVFGRGMRFNIFRVDNGTDDTYWAALDYVPADFQETGGSKEYLQERFAGVTAPVPALLAATDEDAIDRMQIYGESPVPRWGAGRFTLLGDAAHPLTTVLGQGAGQALEDAMVLADCLSADPDLVAGLRTYERRRQERTGSVIKLISTLSSAASEETALRTWIRDQILIKRLFRRTIGKRFEATLAAAGKEF
jgi:2-polyprenyl-6-methoxyphenol hydroxylase-like FAD-dependent oxidoreductase